MKASAPIWWTTHDVAVYLKTTEPVVRFLVNRGLLPVNVVHNRCFRFEVAAIQAVAEKLGLMPTAHAENAVQA
ncbi:MAG: hypothetical protein A2351_07105 [Omnitrophica bacterium RIFOXYB12_FULL_50_7]|nr:MAG: hypothetical protein A2351_07105 [Omnitrophica bacterium RIFOXYB12_FULL_50_7]